MFIYNCWYVAATAQELECDQLFARTFLGEPVVLYRKADGTVVALEDRCCHRLAPLSLGCVVQDTIQCGYHGFRFDESGRCVHIPGQEKIPSRAAVRAYPTIERHGLIWIWMGDPALSHDESSIPDALSVLDKQGWDARASYVHVKSGYRLIVDNLQDGSHAEFVHAKTLRVDGLGEAMRRTDALPEQSYKFEVVDGNIRHNWRVMNTPGAPAFVKGLCLQNGLDYEEVKTDPVNWQLETIWYAPTIWTFTPVTYLSGHDPKTAASWVDVIIVTPETENTTHYFWADAQNYNPEDTALTDFYHSTTHEAFAEDVAVFEAQQRTIGAHDVSEFDLITVSGDAASVQARRILAALKDREAGFVPAGNRKRELAR